MQVLDRIYLEIWKNNEICVSAVQGEANARFLEIQLCNNGVPVRLNGQIANLYMTKPDGTQIFNQCTIEEEENGLITVGLTAQMSSAAGFVKNMELWISGTDGSLLKVRGMTMDILPSNYEEAIESSDEMTAFQNAMAAVNDIETIRSLAQGAIPSVQKGAALGVATLNADGKLKQEQLPKTVASVSQVCNPNLLDNWYLTLPVNQRGKSSYSVSGLPYTVDRWRAGGNTSGTISVVAGGVQLSAGTAIQQYFENVGWGGKTVTFSAMIEGSIYEAAFVWKSGQDYTIIKTFENGLRLAYSRPNKYVQLYNSNSDVPLTIRSVKLELGGTSTLGNSPQPNYGEELSKCQRYQLPISLNQGRACVIGAGSIAFMIPTPVTMRANPAITGGDLSVRNPQLGTTVSGFTFSVFLSGNNGIGVTAAKTSHGMTDATLYAGDTGTYVMLDANL